MNTSRSTTRCSELTGQFTEKALTEYSLEQVRTQSTLAEPPFSTWTRPDGSTWASFFRVGVDYLARFHELADFTISENGKSICAYPVPGVSKETIEHLFLNQITPLALSRQFELVLHGSAVVLGDFAVAFLGFSGSGKSTLAASFATTGYEFLTDDGLLLKKAGQEYLALPSHPSIRLWDDSHRALIPDTARHFQGVDYTPKNRVLADDAMVHSKQPRPLRHIYFLGDNAADSVSISAVMGREALIETLKNSFLLDVEEQEMLSCHFKQLSTLAQQPIFFRLNYPRRYDALPQVREAIMKHAQQAFEHDNADQHATISPVAN